MRYTLILLFLAAVAFGSEKAEAQGKSDFCRGFEEGWKAYKGGTMVPLCPLEPSTPLGSNSYREGIKAGSDKARETKGTSPGYSAPTRRARTYCEGFEEGWKTIKGDIALVPLCPLEPLTPLGSTPYREGLKAGIAKAEEQ